MFEGWKWRYSRAAEVAMLQAAVIGNRIPMNQDPVDVKLLLSNLRFYSED